MLLTTRSRGNHPKKTSPESHTGIQIENGVGGAERRRNGGGAIATVGRSPQSVFAVEDGASEGSGGCV